MKTRLARQPLVGLLLLLVVAGCSTGGGASPAPATPGPSPTPIEATVKTPEDAASLVIATDARFAGLTKLNPDVIGASAWWISDPIQDGGFRITITQGWGDCPAGCINKHVWIYEVTASGQVTLVDESGEPLPAGPIQP